MNERGAPPTDRSPTAQLIVRRLDPEIVRRLRMRAVRHGRSAEAEHRAILEAVLRPDGSEFWERARALREETRGRGLADSAELIRRDRDRQD
jgi:plasmid stability protein